MLRGVFKADEYPSEATARAIIAAVDRIASGDAPWNALDRLAVELGADLGDDEASTVAARAFAVYGFPELAPGVVSQKLSEALGRRPSSTSPTTITTTAEAQKPLPAVTYGFNRPA